MSTENGIVQREREATKRRARSIYLRVEDDAEIQVLMEREHRRYSQQCEVLIREALDARRREAQT